MKAFNRAADHVERIVSHAAFFIACVLMIILWAPLVIWLDLNTWQLVVNTATTIVTFLLLALLTNTQRRFEQRTDDMLNRIYKMVEVTDDARSTEAPGSTGPAE
jgi:low affinity Fe/Cu permease